MSGPEAASETILVVEDDPVVRGLIGAQIGRLGHACRIANSGAEALDLIATEPPAVVITDMRMPGIGGLELLRRVKTLSPPTQVVMVSGVKDQETVEECERAGACDYLMKPFQLEDLASALRRALKLYRDARR